MIKIGIIGLGYIGKFHVDYFCEHRISGAQIVAVCDANLESLKWAKGKLGGDAKFFTDVDGLLGSGIDAVIVATPHYSHPEIAEKSFRAGLHVMIEKPAGVYAKKVKQMNEAAQASGKVFSIMFQHRMSPMYRKIKEITDKGLLGKIARINLTMTDWYRPQSYYDKDEWRGTWKGEGGGVLINQCPHQLDLQQWIFGMPKSVYAKCFWGKHHDIQVEDEVIAWLEYEDEMTCTLTASTGEYPGRNSLEIIGDKGRITADGDTAVLCTLDTPLSEFNPARNDASEVPAYQQKSIDAENITQNHAGLTQNWINAINFGEELISPGVEGINSLNISNAIYLSSWLDKRVGLPADENLYFNELKKRW